MTPPLLRLISGTSEWGKVTLGGGLGYESQIAGSRVVAHPGILFDEIISAHARSDLMIELHETASVQGFIACSSPGNIFNPVLFTINFNSVGLAWQALDATESIVLTPGIHRLRCICQNKPNGLHSAWGFQRAPNLPASSLAIMTVGRYPLDEVDWKLMGFTRSATRFGSMVTVCGAGESMSSWADSKIRSMLESVRSLQNDVTHILFCDGSDCALLGNEVELFNRFQKLGVEFLISTERNCWPVKDDPEWRACFPKTPGGRRFPNAGVWMGTRKGVEAALTECMRIHREVKEDRLPPSLKRWKRLEKYVDDDQWLFQMAFLGRRIPIHLDFRYDIFSNMGLDCRLLEENPDYNLIDGRLHSTACGTFPLVIHFSGGNPGRTRWQARLGVLRGPARLGSQPAGADIDPYQSIRQPSQTINSSHTNTSPDP